ncbi:MAG: hypothetical protein WCX71_05345 [Candidatus Buchananbacteria bacterium]
MSNWLVGIAAVGVLSVIFFWVFNPPNRFAQAKNYQRLTAVNAIIDSYFYYIHTHQGQAPVDLKIGINYMIGSGMDFSGCLNQPTAAVIDLSYLAGKYISRLPIDPSSSANSAKTYYYINRDADNKIIIGSCLAESLDGQKQSIYVRH